MFGVLNFYVNKNKCSGSNSVFIFLRIYLSLFSYSFLFLKQMYTTVPVNENCIKLFLFDPELPCLCFSSSKISDQFFICLFLSGNIQIHLSHSHGFPEFEKPKKWRLIRSIYRPNSWNKIPTQKLCHTWNKNGDRIKGRKLRRFGKLNLSYHCKLWYCSLSSAAPQ